MSSCKRLKTKDLLPIQNPIVNNDTLLPATKNLLRAFPGGKAQSNLDMHRMFHWADFLENSCTDAVLGYAKQER